MGLRFLMAIEPQTHLTSKLSHTVLNAGALQEEENIAIQGEKVRKQKESRESKSSGVDREVDRHH